MIKEVCTIEQMEALKALGVDVSKASACLLTIRNEGKDEVIVSQNHSVYRDAATPVFTISDMLNMMPDSIINERYKNKRYYITFSLTECFYFNNEEDTNWMEGKIYYGYSDNFKDAIYNCLFQLAKDSKLLQV